MTNKEFNALNKKVGVMTLMKATNMTRKEILQQIEKGNIAAFRQGNRYFFDPNEVLRIEALHKNHIGLWELVKKLYNDGTKYIKAKTKRELLEFLSVNNWFGATPINVDEIYFYSIKDEVYFLSLHDVCKIKNRIHLWINSYEMDIPQKIKLVLAEMNNQYPKTSKLLGSFFNDVKANKTIALKLLDYLYAKLNCELQEMNDETLEELIVNMDSELQLNTAKLFAEFLMYLKENKITNNNWMYNFLPRYKIENNNAYPMQTFIQMAYVIFNEESWKSRSLIDKALSKKKYAELWLFISLHFICGWRGSDIVRLPMPKLSLSGEEIRTLIAANKYDSIALLNDIEFRIKYASMKPSKTEKHLKIPQLKLFVPESLRKPIGLILAMAVSWHDTKLAGEQFLNNSYNSEDIEKFFGSDFSCLCEDKRFSSRRANKAYLQGIEAIAETNEQNKPKGYMLAALARSHKGGLGKLSEITDIYLKDANFTGYTPEFIAKEMFERGIFSFIPYMILEIYTGKTCKDLSVTSQTSLIVNMGIKPYGLENMAKTIQTSLNKSSSAIAKIMDNSENIRTTSAKILCNVATGNAASKQEGCMCLLIAADLSCAEPSRSCCLGCEYEIYTKNILKKLVKEYNRLITRKENSSKNEAVRCSKILKTAIMPAIAEIITTIKLVSPGYDVLPILNDMKGGQISE